jgi:tRNA-uridine 2-sulfurtransferase
MKPTIAVAVSGGVDSLTAAFLLKRQGYPVFGVHFITGYESDADGCGSSIDRVSEKFSRLGKQIDIPIELMDCRKEFKQNVVDYFVSTYLSGRTPNPCLRCNPEIKFGKLMQYVIQQGAERLATGHYARIQADDAGKFHLLKGADPRKDQSYFLARLTQAQLAKACFPLGGFTKSEIKRIAQAEGLRPVMASESQDICFIKNESYQTFLAAQPGFKSSPGPIVDRDGNTIGEHRGLHRFTIGQRRGINCPASEPYYVIRIDREANRLVVGSKQDLLRSECRVVDINWIQAVPREPQKVYTRVRYRNQEVPSTVVPEDERTAIVRFQTPQAAVTPGQGAVFYQEDEILGGGWIEDKKCLKSMYANRSLL